MIKYERIQPNSENNMRIFEFSAKNLTRYITNHWHSNVELLYCSKGKLNVWMNSTLYTLAAGDMILLNSDVVHASQSPEANNVLVLQLPIDFLEKVTHYEYNRSFVFELNSVCNPNWDYKEITNLLNKIKKVYSSNRLQESLLLNSYLYLLIYLCVERYQSEIPQKASLKTERYRLIMTEIITYIRKNFQEELSLNEVATHFNYSSTYFSKLFQKYMGIKFSDYLLSIRIENAYRLLMNTDKPIIEIAIESGFNNTRTFYNGFKKYYLIPPSEYRRKKKDKIFPI